LKGTRRDFTLTIKAPEGDISMIPAARTYRVELFGVAAVGGLSVTCKDGSERVFAENPAANGNADRKDGMKFSADASEKAFRGSESPTDNDGKKISAFFDGRSLVVAVKTDKIYGDIRIAVDGAEYAAADKEEYIKNVADKIETGFFKKARRYKKYKNGGSFAFKGLRGIDREFK
jgi:hypothetical protein